MRLIAAGLVALLAPLVLAQSPADSPQINEASPRFYSSSPLTALPPITLDRELQFVGPTKVVSQRANLQARILWIDATANIDRYNTETKIVELVERIRRAGFNTIVLDVKPISGETIYPSAFAPKIREWRGKTLPLEFDPVAVFAREARRKALVLFGSMNAFSDGHRLFNAGPGFARPEEQSVVYEPSPILRAGFATYPIATASAAPMTTRPEESVRQDTVPPEMNSLRLLPNLAALPGDRAGFFVIARANGTVLDGYEWGLPNAPLPTVARGGIIVYGEGAAATFLRLNATPGFKISADATTNFVPLAQSVGDRQIPLMTQPTNPVVRKRLVDLATEFVGKYDVAGLIYDDRLRYTGMDGDFSPAMRAAFETKVGKTLRWPDDVFRFTYNLGLGRGVQPGPYFAQWMAFRPAILKEFVVEIRRAIRAVKPEAQLGVYAGSWYGEYPSLGQNWADPHFQGPFWANDELFSAQGLAPHLDLLITGCYYTVPTVYEGMRGARPIGSTVESAGTLTYQAVRDATWTVAGISLADFKDDPDLLGDCLQAAVASTNGVMVFDLSHDIEPMWPTFERAFRVPKVAPYARASFLEEVRRRLAAAPPKYPRIIVTSGTSGIGQ